MIPAQPSLKKQTLRALRTLMGIAKKAGLVRGHSDTAGAWL